MKPTSPLSLLLFLRLASAAPLPLTLDSFPSDCHSKSCVISFLDKPHNNHHTPPTHFTEPHFPTHQLDNEHPISDSTSSSTLEDVTTPSLSSERPLSSSFLLSLANPASQPTMQKAPMQKEAEAETTSENLPAKPSSALPELRAADLRKYWETLRPSPVDTPSAKEGRIPTCTMGSGSGDMVGSERFYYMRRTRTGVRRDYADLMVVGIVVLFLAVVVALEAVERVGDLGTAICGRRQRRGEIYLAGDDDNLFVVKKPFELSPAPLGTRSREFRDEKVDFHYDSDAFERV